MQETVPPSPSARSTSTPATLAPSIWTSLGHFSRARLPDGKAASTASATASPATNASSAERRTGSAARSSTDK